MASRLDVEPSSVSRVARDVRQSVEVEAAIDHENRQIMKILECNHNGFVRRSANCHGVGRHRIKRARIVKK